MSSHKYKIGQSVSLVPSRQSMRSYADAYKIVQLLPTDGIDNLYRVKSADEPYERMVREREVYRVL